MGLLRTNLLRPVPSGLISTVPLLLPNAVCDFGSPCHANIRTQFPSILSYQCLCTLGLKNPDWKIQLSFTLLFFNQLCLCLCLSGAFVIAKVLLTNITQFIRVRFPLRSKSLFFASCGVPLSLVKLNAQ